MVDLVWHPHDAEQWPHVPVGVSSSANVTVRLLDSTDYGCAPEPYFKEACDWQWSPCGHGTITAWAFAELNLEEEWQQYYGQVATPSQELMLYIVYKHSSRKVVLAYTPEQALELYVAKTPGAAQHLVGGKVWLLGSATGMGWELANEGPQVLAWNSIPLVLDELDPIDG